MSIRLLNLSKVTATINPYCNIAKLLVRFKGGGRPGGKPTFNWKEKRILGLDKVTVRHKLPPFGDFNKIEDVITEESADNVIDLTNLDSYEEHTYDNTKYSSYKKIQPKLLFGSNKRYGVIKRKRKPSWNHFRFQRNNNNNSTTEVINQEV